VITPRSTALLSKKACAEADVVKWLVETETLLILMVKSSVEKPVPKS